MGKLKSAETPIWCTRILGTNRYKISRADQRLCWSLPVSNIGTSTVSIIFIEACVCGLAGMLNILLISLILSSPLGLLGSVREHKA